MNVDKGGRPSKYNWDKIQEAYESGIDIETICTTFSVNKKTLQNKISAGKWEVLGSYNADMEGFKEASGKVSGYFGNSPEMDEIVAGKVQTILEDNELIENNRKILKALQREMAMGIKEGKYKTPQAVNAGASAVRNIEAVANPKDTAAKVNVQQNTVVANGDAITDAIKRKYRNRSDS
jgi:hypothetical protein